MRDDLLDAQACVDWTVSQINVLRRHLIAWDKIPPYTIVREPHPQSGNDVLRFGEVQQIPALINAQVGAMINSLRASLDILVNRLAERAGYSGKEDSHFPICRDRASYFTGKHAGRKSIKRLSEADQLTIEKLEPWAGGKDPLIYALHDLDITRKHKRLVGVYCRPTFVMTAGAGAGRPLSFHGIAGIEFESNAPIRMIDVNTQYEKIDIAFDVRLNEAGPLEHADIIAAMLGLSTCASGIIGLFDTP
jgi:hypothetical protein